MTGPADAMFKTHPPKLAVGGGNPEATKYGKLWKMEDYRKHSPGEHLLHYFYSEVKPKEGSHVIDFGCGSGRASARLKKDGFKVTMMDFVRACLDESVFGMLSDDFKFIKHDLENPIPVVGEYGYCSDVMEHIPTDKVHRVLANILRAAKHCFFAIATVEDVFGKTIGETLHLTVRPYEWWLQRFQEHGCMIHWSGEAGSYAFFYVTIWEEAQVLVERGELNASEELIQANILHNCQQGWEQVQPCKVQDLEVMILGGGPSLSTFEHEIKRMRESGVKLATLNGTYNWAIERGLTPSTQIIVDARDFNARFTKPVVDECKYLLASQCHPDVFEGLPKERVFLWHSMGDTAREMVKKYYEAYWPIPGGTTVLLRAIPLLRMLGFRKFHLFGCDSCLEEGQHHAYAQPENDSETVVPIMVTGGKTFYCHPWMASQAREFITLIQKIGETFDMIVHGEGLLAHIINTGAEMEDITQGGS